MQKAFFEMDIKYLKRFVVAFVFGAFFILAQSADCQQVSAFTYNIRFANPDDGPNFWPNRMHKVFKLIKKTKPDVFGLQEALHQQVLDVEKIFPAYARVGQGRDDGKQSGEYSPVFFRTDKFQLLRSGTFWLSQTPDVAGSRGWDAACNRVVTWVNLNNKSNGKQFFVFCTHFDHVGELARRNSALLLLKAVDSLAGENPAIVMGDFNATPNDEPYKLVTDTKNPLSLADSRLMSNNKSKINYSFTGFRVQNHSVELIDHIFVKNIFRVKKCAVDDENDGIFYPSDHLPVHAIIELFK